MCVCVCVCMYIGSLVALPIGIFYICPFHCLDYDF